MKTAASAFLLIAAMISPLALAHGDGPMIFQHTNIDVMRSIDSDSWQTTADVLVGNDDHKLLLHSENNWEESNLAESDTDLAYAHYINEYGLWYAGVNFVHRPGDALRGVVGAEYLWPWQIETRTALYLGDGAEVKLELLRHFALTQHLDLELGVETRFRAGGDTDIEAGTGWNYVKPHVRLGWRFNPSYTVYLDYRAERAHGQTEDWQRAQGEDTSHEGLFAGFSASF